MEAVMASFRVVFQHSSRKRYGRKTRELLVGIVKCSAEILTGHLPGASSKSHFLSQPALCIVFHG
jgi:hypothetical protein